MMSLPSASLPLYLALCSHIVPKSNEQNGIWLIFSPLYATNEGYYIPETTWYGNVYDPDFSAEDNGLEEEEWEELKANTPFSVVLWPVN